MSQNLIQAIRNNEIDLDKAMEKFDLTAKHISEGSLSDLTVGTISCGFPTLDDYKLLKTDGELIILGARPSMGKSSLLLQIAGSVATNSNVLFFSLEMSYKSLKRRLLAMHSGRSIQAIQEGKVSEQYLLPSLKRIKGLNLFIEDSDGNTINDIKNKTLAFHKHHPLGLVVVDYLQKVPAQGVNRADEVRNVAQSLKDLAVQLKRPVLAAAQLNRSCEERGKKAEMFGKPGDYRPIGSDIGESDKVQHIADVILFVSREEIYNSTRKGEADLGVYKNRDGKTGWEVFGWEGSSTQFKDKGLESI